MLEETRATDSVDRYTQRTYLTRGSETSPFSAKSVVLNTEDEFSTVAPKEASLEDPLVEYETSA